MAGLSEITVNRGQGGLGRRALSEDGISGLVFYNDTPPAGFTADVAKAVNSLEEAETLGVVSGGTYAVEHYHVSEFFRANPDGKLWLGFYAVPVGAYDFTEIQSMQTDAQGEIRLMGVYAPGETFDGTTQSAAFQAAIDGLPDGQPVRGFIASDMSGLVAVSGWSGIVDLRTLTNLDVTFVVGQDGNGQGKALYDSLGYTISVIGRVLGDTSVAAVNQSIGEPGAFNISNGTELEVAALANGDLVSEIGDTVLGQVKDKGYAVIRKRLPDLAGTFHERTPAAVAFTSDYAFIENSRVVDKVERLLRAVYTPYLNTRVLFNTDGTLADSTIGFFQDIGQDSMDTNLEAVGEISASEVKIDPTQDVLATSTLTVSVDIVPTGIAEFITINIALTPQL